MRLGGSAAMGVPAGADAGGCCALFRPGVVLALEQYDLPPPDCRPTAQAGFLQSPAPSLASRGSTLYSPAARLALRAYFVPPGSELSFLATLSRSANVLDTSLDYLGQAQSATAIDATASPVFSPLDSAVLYLNDPSSARPLQEHGVVATAGLTLPAEPGPVVAVVDAGWEHCQRVVETVARSYSAERAVGENALPVEVVAVTLNEAYQTAQSLWSYSTLLLSLCDVPFRVSAVNLSVDLGGACGTREGLPSPLATFIYSFPLFERLLQEFISSRLRLGFDTPLIFAAAGNRDTAERHWRLAYPAVMPEVIAVTQVDDQGELLEDIDLPAVSPLKPCFAEQRPPEPDREGTSFACAALAGRWASWEAQFDLTSQKLVRFAKLACLCARSTAQALGNATRTDPWIPCVVQRFSQGPPHGQAKTEGLFLRQLLTQLNNADPQREYVLTGSGAFVHRWLEVRVQDQGSLQAEGNAAKVLGLVSDLDLLYAGPPLDGNGSRAVRRVVEAWLGSLAGSKDKPAPKVRMHPIREWANGIHLLQCVIPAANAFLTQSGVIDPWASPGERLDGELQIFVPPPHVWPLNPHYRSGEAGLASALLIWLNLMLLRERVRILIEVSEPEPVWQLPDSLRAVPQIQKMAIIFDDPRRSGDGFLAEKLASHFDDLDLEVLYGWSAKSAHVDRVTPRLDRTAQLAGSDAGAFWASARTLHQVLCLLWRSVRKGASR